MQSGQGFLVARTLQELLKRTAVECSIPLPRNIESLVSSPQDVRNIFSLDDFIDACTRPTYLQPVFNIQSRFSTTFSSDWAAEAPALSFKIMYMDKEKERIMQSKDSSGAQNLMNQKSAQSESICGHELPGVV